MGNHSWGVPGYAAAPDQNVTLGSGASVSISFTDPRQFQVIVLVCRLSDHTLYASSVTFNGTTLTSLAAGGGGTMTDLALCDLGGATFGPQQTGTYAASVTIPK